ncbi:hypothetical protein JCM10212_002072 [Sporobolomyces blumeae]
MRLWGVYVQLCLVAHLAHAQHQLAFGLSTGQQLRRQAEQRLREAKNSGTPDEPVQRSEQPQVHFAQSDPTVRDTDSLSASDLYALALSLLDSLTAHSAPNPQTPYLPYLSTPAASVLDDLEDWLGPSSLPSRTLRTVRTYTERLYAGKPKRAERAGRDWSVRGVVVGMKRAVETFTKDKAMVVVNGGRARKRNPKLWRDRLQEAPLKGGIVLNDDETREGMLEVVRLVTLAAEKGNGDAWVLLGDLHLTGHLTLPANTTASLDFYTHASEDSGSPEAQYKLGLLYGTNYGGALGGPEGRGQQGSALLHYTFAALSGHAPASMTVGYRHWAGIGAKQSCKEALPWYKSAAESAMRTFNAGPPGGLHLPPPKLRLSDLSGGVYGPGASARAILSTGGSTAQTAQEWADLLEFHQFHADRGDPTYMFRLGRLYYGGFGAGGLGGTRSTRGRLAVGEKGLQDGLADGGRDFARASRWFVRLGRKFWTGDGKDATWNPAWGRVDSRSGVASGSSKAPATQNEQPRIGFYDASKDKRNDKLDEQSAMVAGLAAGYLGRMYLRGEGVHVNYAKAFLWFKRGSSQGDRESNNGLGIMYRDGLGVERNLKTAIMHFHAAAQQDLADAQVNLGKYHFALGDTVVATTFFEAAIRSDGLRQPDTFQAYYYLAEIASRSSNPVPASSDNCPVAVSFYKHVAERGDWDHEVWFEAERARERGDLRTALLGYWMMAERGYEVAQNNVAWILDRDKSRIRVPFLDSPAVGSNETDRLALTYWTRSAAQDNVDALVKLGDYYFKGLGTGARGAHDGVAPQPQYEKAATFYQSAATSRLSAMAMWNLGWMHETGRGVPQDFHLAKRYLDSALETSPNAYFPSTLSLISLYARALYHVVFSPSDEMNALSLFGRDPDPLSAEQEANGFVPQGNWGFGRAWRDVQRSWGIDPGPEPEVVPLRPAAGGGGNQADVRARQGTDDEMRRELEGGETWEYQRRVGEDEDDEFYVEDDGDFGGTVAIIALCMLLAWLLYFRQQRPAEPGHLENGVPPLPAPGQAPVPPGQDFPRPTPTNPAPNEDDARRAREGEEDRRLV